MSISEEARRAKRSIREIIAVSIQIPTGLLTEIGTTVSY